MWKRYVGGLLLLVAVFWIGLGIKGTATRLAAHTMGGGDWKMLVFGVVTGLVPLILGIVLVRSKRPTQGPSD